jgi:hypothetical protein
MCTGVVWFITEDVCDRNFEMPRFDMWSGPSNDLEMRMLTMKTAVVVYSDPKSVPSELMSLGPSLAWTAHFQKMRQRVT